MTMAVTKATLRDAEEAFEDALRQSCPELLEDFPVACHVSSLRKRNPNLQYEHFPLDLRQKISQIRSDYGQETLALYLKLGLCRLMADTLESLDGDRFPAAIRSLYLSWFERVVEDCNAQPDSYYDLDRPLWPLRKDLGVCSGRTIPIGGAWVIEERLLARHAMIRNASVENASRVRRMFTRLFDHKDKCYVIHTVERYIQDFNAEQMDQAYRNIASLLQVEPDIWGVYRSSWFLDPAVSEISPNMAFLAEVPADNGADFYDGGPCLPDDVRKATALSPERSRLHESGEYLPRSYFYFWPRAAVINAFGGSTHEP